MSKPSPRFSAGRLFYLLLYQPRTWLEDRVDQYAGHRGETARRAAAATLPPQQLLRWGLDGPPCRFLTGKRFVDQTIFCARSFEWACGTHVRLELFSDGTLEAADIEMVKRSLPHATVVNEPESAARLDRILPANMFPSLRRMRNGHPLMRKLLDLHAGYASPSLYLDSDMLFFSTPRILTDWLRSPDGEYFMDQGSDALVDSRERLECLFSQPLLAGVNSGILAINDNAIDWVALEQIASRLSPAQSSHQWAEQTLFAWHLSRCNARPLPRKDYRLCNNRADLRNETPVLRHYVHKAKPLFAATEWRRWLRRSQTIPVDSYDCPRFS